MELSTEERKRIYEEEKARFEARNALRKQRRNRQTKPALCALAIVLSSFAVVMLVGKFFRGSQVASSMGAMSRINTDASKITGGNVASPAPTSAIKGAVYLTMGSGESFLQRGHEILLIQRTPAIETDVNELGRIEGTIATESEKVIKSVFPNGINSAEQKLGILLNSEILSEGHLEKTENYFSLLALRVTRTSAEGRYTFDEIQNGDYYIFATFKNAREEGYWLVGAKVKQPGVLEVDLGNHNFKNLSKLLLREALEDVKTRLITEAGFFNELRIEQVKYGYLQAKLQALDKVNRLIQYPSPRRMVSQPNVTAVATGLGAEEKKQIQVEQGMLGCTTTNDLDRVAEYTEKKEAEALTNFLRAAISNKICSIFLFGEQVVVTDRKNGREKLRRKGEMNEYWMLKQATGQ